MSDKKRSNYKSGNMLDFPEEIMDRKKYGYRWINKQVLEKNSDGYDPRGWGLFKNTDGKNIERGDLILGQMPIDQYQEMLATERQDRDEQVAIFMQNQAASEDRLSHEFRKRGGKVKFNFTQE